VDRRKLKALRTVERIRQHALDVEASRLGDMQSRMAGLERRREDLGQSLLRKGTDETMIEFAPYLTDFIRATRSEIDRCNSEIEALKGDLDAQEELVAEKFTEKKTVDLVAEAEAHRLNRAAERKARVAQDDLTVMRHRLKAPQRLS